jgi:hypothetical protein
MHQNLLNAEFASVWYLSDYNENMQGTESLNRLQKSCTSPFDAHMPATECIPRVNKHILKDIRYSIKCIASVFPAVSAAGLSERI